MVCSIGPNYELVDIQEMAVGTGKMFVWKGGGASASTPSDTTLERRLYLPVMGKLLPQTNLVCYLPNRDTG